MNKLLFYIRRYLKHCALCGSKEGRWRIAGIPAFGYKNGYICAECLETLYDKEKK